VSFADREGKIHETPIVPGIRASDHSPSAKPSLIAVGGCRRTPIRLLSHCSIAGLPVGTLAQAEPS
jgi:hypothetical protein